MGWVGVEEKAVSGSGNSMGKRPEAGNIWSVLEARCG